MERTFCHQVDQRRHLLLVPLDFNIGVDVCSSHSVMPTDLQSDACVWHLVPACASVALLPHLLRKP